MKLQYKINLLTSKLDYLRRDKEHCQEISKEAMAEFHAEFSRVISHLSEHQRDLIYGFIDKNLKSQKKHKEIKSQNKEAPESIKKIFKEIAKKTHPDLTGEENSEIFQKAQSAVDEHSYSEILQIAKELDIPPPEPTEEDIRLLEKEVGLVSIQVRKIKETYAWTWYNASDRESVMERYVAKTTKMCSGS